MWSRRSSLQEPLTFIVDDNGLTSSTENRFSVSPLQVINSTAALYSHKITIYPVRQSDQGFYQCFVNSVSNKTTTSTEIDLFVYQRDEFPVCFPDGPAAVTIDSTLSCKTLSDTRIPIVSDIRMPDAGNVGWVTTPTNDGGSQGQELIRTVTNSEHEKTFQCFSADASAMSLACNIGPLTVMTVVSLDTTQSPVLDTTVYTTNTMNNTASDKEHVGLSGADIAGIVIGVILFIIIIAVHTLCCRCNPKRWLHAKSYTFNIMNMGSSVTTSRERDNAMITLPDAEFGSSGSLATGNLYSSYQASLGNGTVTATYGSDTEDDHQQPAPTDASTSEQPDPTSTDPKPQPTVIYAQVNKTVPETVTKESFEPNPPAVYAKLNKTIPEPDIKESTAEQKPSAIYAQVNKSTPAPDTKESTEPKPRAIYAQVNKPIPAPDTKESTEPKAPAVYAQVNKTTPESDTKESTEPKPPAIYAQVNKPIPEPDTKKWTEPKPSAIYAQVNKTTPESDTLELTNPQPNSAVINDKTCPQGDAELPEETGQGSTKTQKIKNIKRFGHNRNGQVVRPPKTEPVIIYADLDLHETGKEVRHPLSDDSQTVYAEIQHKSWFS